MFEDSDQAYQAYVSGIGLCYMQDGEIIEIVADRDEFDELGDYIE